jgi:hypothetical protein
MGSISIGATAAVGLALSLTACQSSGGGGLLASSGSPAGKPIALESIEGVSAPVRTALSDELASAATSRRVELVGTSAEARYRVRGYLSTETTADGASQLAFVWDVFDAQKRRTNRVTGTSPMQTASLDGLDKEALRRLAAESMEGLATFLSASASAVAPLEASAEAEPDAS